MRTTAICFHSTLCLPFHSLYDVNNRHRFSFYPFSSISLPLQCEPPPSVFILPIDFRFTASTTRTTAIGFHSTLSLPCHSLFNANHRHQFSFYPLTSVSLPLRREPPPSVFFLPIVFHLSPFSTRTSAISFHSTLSLPFESLFNANIRHQFSFYPLTSVSLPLRREQPPSVFILPFLLHLTPSSMRTTAISFHSTHRLPFHCLYDVNNRHRFSFNPFSSIALPLQTTP